MEKTYISIDSKIPFILTLRFLENEIHKTNLKLMEGETIKKKYTSILDMLKKERLTFSNQLEALESTIKKQDDEIDRLKNTQKVIKIMKPNWLVKLCNRRPFLPEMLPEQASRSRRFLC